MPRSGSAHVPAVRRAGVIALALAAGALIAACGGSSRHRAAAAERVTPATLLDQTAGAAGRVDSGQLQLTVDLALDGVKQLGGMPITLDVSGPFAQDAHHRASTSLTVALTAGQSNVRAGLVVVGGVAYLGLGGEFYKLGRDEGAKTGEGATGVTGATGPRRGPTGPLGALGIDPAGWLVSPRIVGTADVAGVTTEHLHATVDVAKALGDIYALVAPALDRIGGTGSSGSSGPTAGSGATGEAGDTGASGASGDSGSPLDSALPLLESAITSASVDVYTGVADHLLRRADIALAFTVPSIAAGALGGLRGGTLNLDLTLSDLGKPQSISAPPDVQSSSKLFNGVLALESQFGSLAPLLKPLGARLPAALGVPAASSASAGG